MVWGGGEPDSVQVEQLKKEREELAEALFTLVGTYPYSDPADITIGEARRTLEKYKHYLSFQKTESIRHRLRNRSNRHLVDL